MDTQVSLLTMCAQLQQIAQNPFAPDGLDWKSIENKIQVSEHQFLQALRDVHAGSKIPTPNLFDAPTVYSTPFQQNQITWEFLSSPVPATFSSIPTLFGNAVWIHHHHLTFAFEFTDDVPSFVNAWSHPMAISVLPDHQTASHQSEYQSLQRLDFTTPFTLVASGTSFQQAVWSQLLLVKSGSTITYQQLAMQLHMPAGARAVGTAVGSNPFAGLIPCHRVLASNGSLQGFKWEIWRKKCWLALERAQLMA